MMKPDQRICPLLSIAMQRPPPQPSALVGVNPEQPLPQMQAAPCLQGSCALWIPVLSHGAEVGGNCALANLGAGVANMAGMLAANLKAQPAKPAPAQG